MTSSSANWHIEPLELGRRTAHRAWFFYLCEDSGPPLDEAERRGLRDTVRVDIALRNAGVGLQQVRDVVLSHLYWDHAASADLFGHARFHVQRSEIDFFLGQAHDHPATSRFFNHHAMLGALLDSGRVDPVDGQRDLRDGVRLLQVGGHTPGSQIVTVQRDDGLAVIAADAIPLNRNFTDFVPNGILVNVIDAIAALKTVRELRPVEVYTGHDPQPSFIPAR